MLASIYAAGGIGTGAPTTGEPGRQRRLRRPVIQRRKPARRRHGQDGRLSLTSRASCWNWVSGRRFSAGVTGRRSGARRRGRGVGRRADLRRPRPQRRRTADACPHRRGRARVLVSADRHLAGCLAESHLDATVHVLDDGFQHLTLARGDRSAHRGRGRHRRSADASGRPAPRRSLSAASCAHAILVPSGTSGQTCAVAGEPWAPTRRSSSCACRASPCAGPARRERPGADVHSRAGRGRRGAAGAGSSRSCARAGWDVKKTVTFPDHHRYSRADAATLADAARAGRRQGHRHHGEGSRSACCHFGRWPLPLIWLPLTVRIEPAPAFREWLAGRLAAERQSGPEVPA